jgi:hypothetical protein
LIDTDTVFILGAGASKPYGYPTGKELRSYICTDFNGELVGIYENSTNKIYGIMESYLSNASKLAKEFNDSSIPSIDLFLARKPEYSNVGKLAIIMKILNDEQKSKFREQSKYPEQDWYSYLYNRMTSSLIEPDSYKNFRNNEVTFITFNYDRSLEQFFYESLKNSFNFASNEEIVEELSKISFHHVYGKIEDLEWEAGGGKIGLNYLNQDDKLIHERFSFDFLQKLSGNIKTVHDIEEPDFSEIHDKILKATNIFILGFGYAKENLEILKINKEPNDDQFICGTSLNFTGREIEKIKNLIRLNLKSNQPSINDMNCLKLLKEYL